MREKKSLSRRGRIGRNLLITLLAGILIWLLQGAPPLTAAGALRRIERESLFTPHSQFQGVLETAWWGPWGSGAQRPLAGVRGSGRRKPVLPVAQDRSGGPGGGSPAHVHSGEQ